MTTTIIILIYVALVFIGYGMLVQSGDVKIKYHFMCAALIVWATVPFLILIIFGKWIYSLSNKLNNE